MSTTDTRSAFYQCTHCGRCCRWPGYVRVTEEDVNAIAGYLGLSVEAFAERYTVLHEGRHSLQLIEREDGACIFLTDANLCRVHPVKPAQCKGFPNSWNFPGFEKICCAEVVEAAPAES